MATDLYDQLIDIKLLQRGWHLARNDARDDFMQDPLRYSDFAVHLNERLKAIAQSILRNSYHPKPLLTIDVPKSSLAVRPGSVLEIEDRIVLYAIACLIAPRLDRKLPEGVYSYRLKPNPKIDELFADYEILKFPFLKGQTIRRRVDIVESWYVAWTHYIEETVCAYEQEGFSHLVVSDIVAYFENIDLGLLRLILIEHLPKQQRIINFLMNLLSYWTWPGIQGTSVARGIPQGNEVSSFLGNIYLLPLDESLVSFAKKREIKYLRYMDDVKILAKDQKTGRDALFLMNEKLRGLRLNIHSNKTELIPGQKIRSRFFDARMDQVNEVVQQTQRNPHIDPRTLDGHLEKLEKPLRTLKWQKLALKEGNLRLFRRLLTAFTLLSHPRMVGATLTQLELNPDWRLFSSAVRYLRVQTRNLKTIPERVLSMLQNPDGLFPCQEAYLFMLLRYVRNIPQEAWQLAKYRARQTRREISHRYVRQQAALLVGQKVMNQRELEAIRQRYEQEKDIEVKRAWIKALPQLPESQFKKIVRGLAFSVEPKLQRLGVFCHEMLFDDNEAKKQISSIFRNFVEDWLVDRLYELDIIAMSKHGDVRKSLSNSIRKNLRHVSRPLIKQRLNRILDIIKQKEGTNG